MGFTVVTDALRAAARTARRAGEGAGAVNVAAEADQIAAAMPGGAAAAAAAKLAVHWKSSVSTWAQDVQAHAKRLEDSATLYEKKDAQSRDGIVGGTF
ncbi:hypothetical protein [Allokutzneria albata]|uniref:Excreted virulence factor EspC, type VII ESX diderm n=1 Tax=Allokutzneria albata TaxID=211114 RepID=A0A1G9X2P8_ALLAB|nr:hypothetical protein [Allokutzneria albata]SDM91010.1 hypothetical protein SAMN04489726_3956 [Allokutzneria albata]